jgi:hypothetical protein
MPSRPCPGGRPRPAALAIALALAAAALLPAVPSAEAARRCAARPRAEVRFDDGRLLVEREERTGDPRNVRERWWACWRPTGRRSLLDDRRHVADQDESALLAVRRSRFLVLGDGRALEVYDGRTGRLTATVPERGALRQAVVAAGGRLAALLDDGSGALVLLGGAGTRGCLLDAGAATDASGDVFGDVSAHGERIEWLRGGVTLGQDLARMTCDGPAAAPGRAGT